MSSSRRLLATLTPLTIKSIAIQRPNNILVTTDLATGVDLTKYKIQINFPGGSLITANGIPYSSTTGTFNLDDPAFTGSYFKAFNDILPPKIIGIAYIAAIMLLVIIVLIIP